MFTRADGYIDLTPSLKQKMGTRSRVRGRYNASEIYFLLNGSTTPHQWMNAPERPFIELMRMWKGIMGHQLVQGLLNSNYCEIKKELCVENTMTLVGKSDYLPPEYPTEVWEFKTSENLMTVSKDYHDHQARLYCSMFKKDKGVVMQPVESSEGIFLKEIGVVERDDDWFNAEIEKLYAFHLLVEQLWDEKEGKPF